MKNIFVFSFLTIFWFNGLVWAEDFVRDSGIDLTTSTLTIGFVPEDLSDYKYLENPTVSCFGILDPSFPLSDISFLDAGITEVEGSLVPALVTGNKACFQQAGEYTVSFTVFDRAGNSTDLSTHSFTIKASDPDEDQITFETLYDNEEYPLADGSDTVSYRMILKDFADNPVTQLSSGDVDLDNLVKNIEYTDEYGDTQEDANLGLLFKQGLQSEPAEVLSPAVVEFGFSALAPTIYEAGHVAKFAKDWKLDFDNLKVKAIDDEGNKVDGSYPTVLNPSNDPKVVFKPLFQVFPRAKDDEGKDKIYLAEWQKKTPPEEDVYTGNRSQLYFEVQKAEGVLVDLDFEVLSADEDYLHYQGQDFGTPIQIATSDTLEQEDNIYDWRASDDWKYVAKTEAFVRNDSNITYPLSLYIRGEYKIDGKTIQYAMGGSGLHEKDVPNPANNDDDDFLNLAEERNDSKSGVGALGYHSVYSGAMPPVGADILGKIRGEIDDLGTSKSSFYVGEDLPKDVRSGMLENALRLIRGANSECKKTTYSASNFEDCDVVIVDKSESGNNQVVSLDKIPAGHKTLLILNGNLAITGDLSYKNPGDAFGVILINAPIKPFPTVGNIFVNSKVSKIVGHYFAEGSFMTNNTNSIANGNPDESNNQLFLQGTLFTNNTLGGSKEKSNLQTPWGAVPDSKPNWAQELTNTELARIYDLHFVRMGNENAQSSNPNAFVIEVVEPDRAPPGFER